ncbi:MAG: hypothetical protein AAB652_01845 [Patescibacteria group bacterium]
MEKGITVFIIGFLLGLPFLVLADSATSTNFKIEAGVIDVGGSGATSSGFNLRTSIGQPGTGISTSTSFVLRGGFLNFPAVTPATPLTPPAPPPSGGTVQVPPTGGGGIPPKAQKPVITPEIIKKCDFNDDGRCNIVDLSIMLFYYEEFGPKISRYDLNGNKTVDFPDVSVLMFYWIA